MSAGVGALIIATIVTALAVVGLIWIILQFANRLGVC